MSDYVETLRKKAREIAKKRATVIERLRTDNEELTKLTAAEAGIEALLRLEGVAAETPQPPPTGSNGPAPVPQKASNLGLAKILKETLADGRIREVAELVEAAKLRGVDFGDKNPWKSVNFTLMGIMTGKTIERLDGDRWRRAA